MSGRSADEAPTVGLDELLRTLPADPAAPTTHEVARYVRSPSDLLRTLVFAVATLVAAAILAVAGDAVLDAEEDLLRLVGLDRTAERIVDGLVIVVGLLVIVGVYAIPIALRRFRLLGYLLVAAVLASLLSAGVLALVGRAAPAARPGGVADQGAVEALLGAAALSHYVAAFVILAPFVTARWRRAGVVLTVVLCGLRLAVAAHLPAELAVSVLVGATAGSATLLAFGRPDQRPTVGAVTAALRAAGLDVVDLTAAPVVARGSTPFVGVLATGRGVFAKALSPREQSADLMVRTYRFVRLRSVGDERPFSSLRRSVEHEALVSLQAHDVGVRTPRLRALAAVGGDSFVLAHDLVRATPLDGPDDALLAAVWEQVALLRRHRIAHRDLRPANVLVDDDGAPWIVDFGVGEVAATDALLDADGAQLLAALAVAVGPERAVASAVAVLGPEAVGAAARFLQPGALRGATRAALKEHHGLLDALRHEVVDRTDIDAPEYVRLERFNARTLLVMAMLAGATYFLLPQLADLPGIWAQVERASWGWIAPMVVASVVTYVGATLALMGSVPDRIAAGRTFATQVACSFTSRLAPSSVGGMALNLRFLQRSGVDPAVGTSGVGLDAAAGMVVHLALMVVFAVWAGRSAFDAIHVPDPQVLLYGLAAVAAVVVLAFAIGGIRHAVLERVVPVLKRSVHGLGQVLRSPTKIALLLGGSALTTVGYICAFYVSTLAFGSDLSFAQVGAIYLIGSAVASAAPTPGGLGAMEAALVAGLVAAGESNTVGVPSVFLFRLVTFWLPILPGWICFHLLQRRQYV